MAKASSIGAINVYDKTNYWTNDPYPIVGDLQDTDDFADYKRRGGDPAQYDGIKHETRSIQSHIHCFNWIKYGSLKTAVDSQPFTFTYSRTDQSTQSHSVFKASIKYDEKVFDESGVIIALVQMEADD